MNIKMTTATAVITACCMLSGSAAAAAQEPVVAQWSDFEEDLETTGYEGEFFEMDELYLKMWIPAELKKVELTEQDREEGYLDYFESKDGKKAMGIMYVNWDGMELSEYAEVLSGRGAVGIGNAVINGLDALVYEIESEDTGVVSFATESGYILEMSYRPLSDEEFSDKILYTTFSIQPVEE